LSPQGDEDRLLLFSGGPYTEKGEKVEEYFCLDTASCYTFVIKDSSGDGFCCSNGLGRYQLFYNSGVLAFESFANFDFERSHVFCGSGYQCQMSTDFLIEHDTGQNNGSIMVIAENGMSPYSYSLNGGEPQVQPLFTDLAHGSYSIYVEDNTRKCSVLDSIEIQLDTGLGDLSGSKDEIRIMPNPNSGFFSFEYINSQLQDASILMQIIDSNGWIIQSRRVSKYDVTYRSQVSLLNYPAGKYYIRLIGENKSKVAAVIKL